MGLDQMQLDELAIRPNDFRPNGNVPLFWSNVKKGWLFCGDFDPWIPNLKKRIVHITQEAHFYLSISLTEIVNLTYFALQATELEQIRSEESMVTDSFSRSSGIYLDIGNWCSMGG